MADMMTFPDTVEEFMEEYKLVDTEQVYTNGTELVPIFRMKQWFEHERRQPEPAAGKWIVHLYKVGVSRYECDTCHARCDIIYPYCPYCGEKKEGERYAID